MLATAIRDSVELGLLLLAACVIVGPLVAERLRVPGLVGLIAVGAALGPSALRWLRPEGFVATIGVAGLLYLMFLAGIELDLRTFAANRNSAIGFGLLTFFIPFALSVAVATWYLDLGPAAAALVGAMWASHTVVAYPEAKAAGLDRSRAVGVAVAATIITDVLALVVLALAASKAPGTAAEGAAVGHHAPLPLWAGIPVLAITCLALLPRLTHWVFAHLLHSRTQRFAWLLASLAGGGVIALAGGIEGLVGAFLAGIGVNRSVPTDSPLMEHTEFIGNAILIPAFLVSVGLSIDPAALIEPATLGRAAVFVAVVVVGKIAAAALAGRVFHFTSAEVAIMAALTIGQAAATLAIAKVGVASGLFNQEMLDAAVVTVVVSVLITSFGTRLAGRHLDLTEGEVEPLGRRVLALAPETTAAEPFARVLAAIAEVDGGLVTPFIAQAPAPPGGADGNVEQETRLEVFTDALTRCGLDAHATIRFGNSTADATVSLAHDLNSTLVVLPLHGGSSRLDVSGDTTLDAVAAGVPVPSAAVRVLPAEVHRVVVLTGAARSTGRRGDLALVLDIVARLAPALSAPVVVFHDRDDPPPALGDAEFRPYAPRSGEVLDELRQDDLLVVPAHVVTDTRSIGSARLRRHLSDVSLIIVGAPGRLRTSRSHGRPLLGAVGQRVATGQSATAPPRAASR